MVAVLLAVGLTLAGCTGDRPNDLGPGRPDGSQPSLPGDGGLSLAGVAASDEVPPVDAVLVDAGWPEVAGWIRERNAEGSPVVVNFFASWCEPCIRELPLLIETAERETDIVFLGVNNVDQRALAEDMIAEYGISFPTLRDASGEVVAEVGGRGLPHTVAFDTDGRLVSRVFGELSTTTLGQLLDAVR